VSTFRPSSLQKLNPEVLHWLREAGRVGDALGLNIFVAGGFVRDLFLGLENRDLDLVVEGDYLRFAQQLAQRLKGKVKGASRFKTAKVEFAAGVVDVAAARREYYTQPAVLPVVEPAGIRADLGRRDFSVNAMALELNSEHFGRLIDPFGGYADLEQRKLRVLHKTSFSDDPTRILRAVRFETRYDLQMESDTLKLVRDAVKGNIWRRLSKDRLRREMILLLQEIDPAKALDRLSELGILEQLFPGLEEDRAGAAWRQAQELAAALDQKPASPAVNLGLLVLNCSDWVRTASFWACRRGWFKVWEQASALKEDFCSNGPNTFKEPLWWLKRTGNLTQEAVLLALALCREREVVAEGLAYLQKLPLSIPELTGYDLRRLGLTPGPFYQEVFLALQEAKLTGQVNNRQEEEELVGRLLARVKE